MLVHDVMTSDPITVTPGTTVKETVATLARHRISTLPVVDTEGHLRGIVTEADLLEDAFAHDPRAHLMPPKQDLRVPPRFVSEVMTSPAVTVHPSTDVAEAAETLITRGFKSMPVVDEHHRLLGVVSRSDLIRSRAREDGEVASDIDQILGTLGHDDWIVQVREGVVSIDGPTTPKERSLAESAASNVAGVVQVRVRTP